MDFLNKIILFLRKPFPRDDSFSGNLKTITYISVFIAFFLYIFQPFDISSIPEKKFLICMGFGAMTFIACVVYDVIVFRWLQLAGPSEKYTFGKWVLNMIGIMLTISIANFIFMRLIIFGYILWEYLPYMISGTFKVGIFPIVFIGAISLLRQEKKYQNIAAEINQKNINPSSMDPTDSTFLFEIPIHQIRYVEALQNYVKIGFVNSGELKEKTERATLKSIMSELKDSSIIKCHRSFLVNRDFIISTSGNAQGLLLTLADCSKTIPVSRSYVPVFREK